MILRFQELSKEFNSYFNKKHFRISRKPCTGLRLICWKTAGKRIRPVLCLLGNELFGPIRPDTWKVAVALETLP